MLKTVGVVSLGCTKNRVDTEVMLGILQDNGYVILPDPAQSDIIIVNTCGFIGPAKEESIETLFEMAQYKTSGRCKLLIATGCMSQRYGAEMKADMPEVDAFLGISDYGKLLTAIEVAQNGDRPLYRDDGERFLKFERILTTPSYSAYVKISDGCSNQCTYCAIPLIRGGYRSRLYEDIISECVQLAQKGVREITLVAQDTSRYGEDIFDGKRFLPQLLEDIAAIEGIHWVRVLYTYPDSVDDALLDAIANIPKVSPYLDIPLQHIDATLLVRMNRRGTPEEIHKLLKKCKHKNLILRTTMIVGFPGETQQQFEALIDFIKEVRFDRLGAFAYSPEEGTGASTYDDQLSDDIKQQRLDTLMAIQQQISFDANKQRIGYEYEVLVEGFENGTYYGRSHYEAPEIDGKILFTAQKVLYPGEFVMVKILDAMEYDLVGVCV